MACRRSITTRASLLARRFNHCVSYVNHNSNDDKRGEIPSQKPIDMLLQSRSFGSSTINSSLGFRSSLFSFPGNSGSYLVRHMSSTIGEGSEKIEQLSDFAKVLGDTTVDTVVSQGLVPDAIASQASNVSEVAAAAADSWLPVAALQYFIDAVHVYLGLNWWAAIALTTVIIRTATIPILIDTLRATSKMTIIRPRMEEIAQKMKNAGGPEEVHQAQSEIAALYKEHGVSPLSPLKGLLIQGPLFVSFFWAISKMVEKVPSLQHGGIYWFTDLTTPDSLYVFPVLTALTFLITVECNMQEGMEGNPVAGYMKTFSRILALLTVPFTMGFPKAIFCYWITSNLYSLGYGLAIKQPAVKKYFNIPIIKVAPPSTSSQPPRTFSDMLKELYARRQSPSSLPAESSKVADRRISSSSVLSQRLKTLEKQVKQRKRNKRSKEAE
ncbi:Membrane insertase YidC/ALB3/OXA1/COX18 [Dillenia turbinata]|uniref:Membrane insertase YidC/ALB3/OXA1/COX18 n=1 Tax=Dillenia turbinata TaxID=194707 RepID=A0AAN8WJY2_9MAGN